ncbi:MAG: diaminopimelate epimerase [Bacteroidota bacterium]|jgi:diaminopimelate epimerase
MILRHMSGAGNTFILLDDRHDAPDTGELSAESVRNLIAVHPRADQRPIEGLVRVLSISTSNIVAEFYNPDGTRGMLCGNGARCALRYGLDNGASTAGALQLNLNGCAYAGEAHTDGSVSVMLPPPAQLRYFAPGTLEDVSVPVWYVNVNSDHVVIDALHDASDPLIALLRHHPVFPRGVNVNMLQTSADGLLLLATFERGVEAITQACGTGAVSAALSMWMRTPAVHDYVIIPPSGRRLAVRINEDGGHITSIELRGDASYDNA